MVMKRLILVGLMTMLAVAMSASAWAEGVFKDDGAAKKDEPAAKAVEPAGQPAAGELPARVVKAIEDKVAMAEKIMTTYQTEMDKPVEKRNVNTANGLKLRAAHAYLGAALEAKKVGASLKDDQKAAVAEKYEKPNRQKAIDMLLELAQAAAEKKDIRGAVALYKQVLQLDPENATAKDALKKLEEEAKTAKTDKGTGNQGGGENRSYDPTKSNQGSRTGVDTKTDWKRTGRSW
jgi:hypothetical protein